MKKGAISLKLLCGAATGLINGVLGGGGGMIVVPVLSALFGMKAKCAHATAIAVILPVTVIAAATYLFGVEYDLLQCAAVAVGVTIGGAVGASVLKRSPSVIVELLFAAVTAAAGVKMIFS